MTTVNQWLRRIVDGISEEDNFYSACAKEFNRKHDEKEDTMMCQKRTPSAASSIARQE